MGDSEGRGQDVSQVYAWEIGRVVDIYQDGKV